MKRIFSRVSRNRNSASQRASRPRLGVELLEDRNVPAVIVVNTTDDEVIPGDNKTSLREAIEQANDTPGLDSIRFAAAGQGLITLDSALGQLDITDDLIINGPGISRLTVSGDGATRVFDIADSGADVIIRGLTIANGMAGKDAPDISSFGGGILNQGNLKLMGVSLSGNQAVGDADTLLSAGGYTSVGGAGGGGVANLGTLSVIGCTFSDNIASGAEGSVGPNFTETKTIAFPGIGFGGGIFNMEGTATIAFSQFAGNRAQGGNGCTGSFAGVAQGGAIYNDATLTVNFSSFNENVSQGGDDNVADINCGRGLGGAIGSGSVTPISKRSAVLNVNRSTFIHNQAIGGTNNNAEKSDTLATGAGDGFGGGIFVYQGNATIRLSTLYGNQALGGTRADTQGGGSAAGGGILFVNFAGGVTGTVEGCAILENHAIGGLGSNGPGGDALGGGIAAGNLGGTVFSGPGSLTIRNTLFRRNFAKGGDVADLNSGDDGGDGLGGAVYNDDQDSQAILSGLTMLNNQALGGAGGSTGAVTGTGGDGLGGGLFNAGTLTLSRSLITRNTAKGGTGGTAGQSLGGGIYSVGAPITLGPAVFVFGNDPDNIVK